MSNRPEHPYVDFLGLKYDSTNHGRSKCSLKFKKAFLNPRNVIHGGVIYALADSGMGEALLSTLEKNQLVATIEIKITYLKTIFLIKQKKFFLNSYIFSTPQMFPLKKYY